MSKRQLKLLSLLLSAAMLVCMLPASFAAAPAPSVSLIAGEANDNGMIPVEIRLNNCIGMMTCDFVFSADEGVAFFPAKMSADAKEVEDTDNFFRMDFNPANGKFCGYFHENLWPREVFQEIAGDDIVFSDSFDPDHFCAGVIPVYVSEEAIQGAALSLEGYLRIEERIINVETTVQLSRPAQAKAHYVCYSGFGCYNLPLPQLKKENEALSLRTELPEKQYTIYFDYNLDAFYDEDDDESYYDESFFDDYYEDEICVEPEFIGWNTKKDGSGTSYAPGDVYTEDRDLLLYAQWAVPDAVELPDPGEYRGYNFLGWYTETPDGESVEVTSETLLTEDIILYARWSAHPMGDVNLNGKLSAADARLVLRAAVHLEAFTPQQERLADMDADNLITPADARAVLRAAVGLDPVWILEDLP